MSATHQDYIGLSKAEAAAKATEADLVWRVIKENGRSFPVTMDYRADRLNFVLVDGVVTKIKEG